MLVMTSLNAFCNSVLRGGVVTPAGGGGLICRYASRGGGAGAGTMGLVKSRTCETLPTGRESTSGEYEPLPNISPNNLSTEVWSRRLWLTAPAFTNGEIMKAGVRTPRDLNGTVHFASSGGLVGMSGGGTWSKNPPCSS